MAYPDLHSDGIKGGFERDENQNVVDLEIKNASRSISLQIQHENSNPFVNTCR